ncbi:PTS sugar transporter subunit IIB [Gemella sp. GH3]|uniref:PTS sugar transporter subunit IIB n=1 Tax=unclassified Gemella TaxID=2624949 RepID=UPI0015D075E7|nr:MULTISPECIES: PTS sugar transporter subunit IIB [unclassified Gemella]MBF0714066.1 PTS sugar transporter subunit IIB [Gemella sp. GH3.1]NYS51018.1 PTS sugar transporter subunit IIB [Gemella sp. GH3]
MKKVILICNAGISNSLLVKHIKEAIKEKNIQLDISSTPILDCKNKVENIDLVLLAPQVAHKLEEIKSITKKDNVEIINANDYANVDGYAILSTILDRINEK